MPSGSKYLKAPLVVDSDGLRGVGASSGPEERYDLGTITRDVELAEKSSSLNSNRGSRVSVIDCNRHDDSDQLIRASESDVTRKDLYIAVDPATIKDRRRGNSSADYRPNLCVSSTQSAFGDIQHQQD